MENILLIGRYDEEIRAASFWKKFDIFTCKTKVIKIMNKARKLNACTAFKERVVVSGRNKN